MNKSDGVKRKALLITSLFINLGLLCYFKYAYFFADASVDLFGTTWEAVVPGAAWLNETLAHQLGFTTHYFPLNFFLHIPDSQLHN